MHQVNIIATTISGSIRDWRKIPRIQQEFERFFKGQTNLIIVDSHKEACVKTREIVSQGARVIVSAGGAGTFNSILEGSRLDHGYPAGLRLAFLRKGSADLIGKVLKIPDDLTLAVQTIARSIKDDRTIDSDVIEITDSKKKHYFIGFGGVGIFGIVPYFTESKFKKYYNGFLGFLFGDRGPFFIGINLAILKYRLGRYPQSLHFEVTIDGHPAPQQRYSNIVILKGDLGNDLPLARGKSLASGDFRVILFEDRGLIYDYRQLIHAWRGDLSRLTKILGVTLFDATELEISPLATTEYMVNLDGLLLRTAGKISYRISDRIKLISG